MTFQYSVTLPIKGNDKLRRFREWADKHMPELSYSLQPLTPVKTETMTVRLRTVDDRARVLHTMSTSPLS
jgi:hypothetical protein